MVENINITTLEVQWSFSLTYMVGFILPKLRSQEKWTRACHTRAPPPPAEPADTRGVIVLISSTH
jgi:hypothetical protein